MEQHIDPTPNDNAENNGDNHYSNPSRAFSNLGTDFVQRKGEKKKECTQCGKRQNESSKPQDRPSTAGINNDFRRGEKERHDPPEKEATNRQRKQLSK